MATQVEWSKKATEQLNEIVRLVGIEALSPADRLTMEAAKSIREDYLHQNAFHETDTYTSLGKQYRMLKLILECYRLGNAALGRLAALEDILSIPAREKIGRAKYLTEDEIGRFDEIEREMNAQFGALSAKESF